MRYQIFLQNLLALYSVASTAQFQTGLSWYQDAYEFLDFLRATWYEFTTDPVPSHDVLAAVVSALSPNIAWRQNQRAAIQVVEAVAKGETPEKLNAPVYGRNVEKATRLLTGELDPRNDAETWPTAARGGPTKTRAFFQNIAGDWEPVTVDGHIMNAALNGARRVPLQSNAKKQRVTITRERTVARAIRTIARHADLKPAQVQAIVWTVYRDLSGRNIR